MKKLIRIGWIILIVALIISLTSCGSGIPADKTVEPSKESVAVLNEAAVLIGTLKYKEAKKLLEDKYDIIKDNDIALNNYGFIEFHIFKDYEKAEELYQRAIKLNPENPEHFRGIGSVYEAKGEYEEAIKYYNKAEKITANYKNVPINPGLAALHMNIGNCYLKLNDRKKAMEAFENSSRSNPFNIKANAVLHRLYVDSEEYEKAHKVWKNDNLIDESGDYVYKGVSEWNKLYKDAVENKNHMTHQDMACLYSSLILYDEAAVEYRKALDEDKTNEDIKDKLYELECYLSFRDELRALLDDYYRERCLNGITAELGFHKRIKPAYEKIAGLFPQINGDSMTTSVWIDKLNGEIEKKFSVRIVNIRANGSMLGAHFGRIIDSSVIHSTLWGKEADLKVITLKNMTSNGLDYWRTMESSGVGGWSISPTEFVKVIQDNGYDGELKLAAFYNKAAREDFIKDNGVIQEDKEEREPLQIYFSPGISFQFINKQITIETEKAKAQGISDNQLQSYLFNRLEKDFTIKVNDIHESQHSIDNKSGFSSKWQGEPEYRAKLSQLACGNMPFMSLSQCYSPNLGIEVNKTHAMANAQVFKDITRYIYDNNSKFPQIDIGKNILAQLAKLSEDDLKGIAIEVFQKNYPDEKYRQGRG